MPDLSRVPASLPETLVCDLIMLMVRDLKVPGVSAATLRLADIRAAAQLYLDRDWTKIPEYRPWTHWNFMPLSRTRRVEVRGEGHVSRHVHPFEG
jgi:hypothetical protein